MQRKNNLLKFKRAIAMIMAIGVIVVLGTIMALSLSLTTTTTKKTVDLYLYEQAILLSKSATEYALLKISQTGCTGITSNDFNFVQDSLYDVNISARYIGTAATGCNDYITTISTPEQNGSVMLDVAISINDTSISTEPIRYFRRTIQKL